MVRLTDKDGTKIIQIKREELRDVMIESSCEFAKIVGRKNPLIVFYEAILYGAMCEKLFGEE